MQVSHPLKFVMQSDRSCFVLKIVLFILCAAGVNPWLYAQEVTEPDVVEVSEPETTGVLSDRLEGERKSAFNPYVISTHKQNFILPVSYTSDINSDLYAQINEDIPQYFRSEEVNFQLSLKFQLNEHDLLFENDAVFAGFTLKAWWQLYSNDVSSPFRESNYQPEVFYFVPLKWRPWGSTSSVVFGLEHQSNGRTQGLSRSWNRLYTSVLIEKGNFFGMIRPWYRIPEQAKETPESSKGDDNPDILDFMGHGELFLGWRGSRYEFSANLRNNFSTKKGAAELSMSFPLFSRFRGVVRYFNGYGDAMIDYNHYQQRLGVGILLSTLF